MAEWTYNGHTFPLDMNDLSGLAAYDAAIAAMKSAFAEIPPDASNARQIMAYCEGIRRLLDTLWGDGTADALLGDSKTVTDYDDLYESFTDFVHEQTEATAKRREALLHKYAPQPNREARRAIEQAVRKITAKSAAKA